MSFLEDCVFLSRTEPGRNFDKSVPVQENFSLNCIMFLPDRTLSFDTLYSWIQGIKFLPETGQTHKKALKNCSETHNFALLPVMLKPDKRYLGMCPV